MRPMWIIALLIVLLPVTLSLAPIEQSTRKSEQTPNSYRQVIGALLTCAGIALLSLSGIGHPANLWIDIIAVGGVFLGAGIAGVRR